MIGRVIPETGAGRQDWPRLVAQEHKAHSKRLKASEGAVEALDARVDAIEADIATSTGGVGGLSSRTGALESRVDALESPSTITLTPGSAPSSPTRGMIYYDDTANKLKCWDGTAWNDLW